MAWNVTCFSQPGPAAALYATDWRPYLLMLALLLLSGAVLWVITLLWTTWIMHRPPRMTAGRALARLGRATPADVGLAKFDELVFNVPTPGQARPTPLAAWWIPHPAGSAVRRCCVMLHGYGDSRAGALAWARPWQRLGFHLLLIDLRAHGDSGGRLSGGGTWEKADLHAVLEELRHRHPLAARQVVLFGVSFGAIIAAACCAERDDIAALVLDSPVDGWASATRRYAHLLGLPLSHAHAVRLRLAERALGIRFDDVKPARTLPGVKCPTLAILPQTDVLVAPEESEAIAAAVEAGGAANRVWRAPVEHNLALAQAPEDYERILFNFLEEALAPAASPAPAGGAATMSHGPPAAAASVGPPAAGPAEGGGGAAGAGSAP